MIKNRIFLLLFLLGLLFSCKKDNVDNPKIGSIMVETDEAFKNVVDALTYRYMKFNPNTKIDLKIVKENQGLVDLFNKKTRVTVMSRELTDKEKNQFEKMLGMKPQPAYFAADALVFIVPNSSSKNSISVQDIKNELSSANSKLIFDGGNTSNTSYIAQKYNLDPQKIKYTVIKGNENIIDQLNKYPDYIGVISYNTISRPYNPKAKELREKIKILSVEDKGKKILPSQNTLRNQSYPFTRMLYFLTNETYYGLGNGLIRFSCTQIGQLIVDKQGLQPYNLYPREVRIVE